MVPLFESKSSKLDGGCFTVGAGVGRAVHVLHGFQRHMSRDAQEKPALYADTIWPGAMTVAERLVAEPGLVRDLSVLEVGCGQHALPSLVAAAVGAKNVLATDHPESGVEAILPSVVQENALTHVVSVSVLDWEEREAGIGEGVVCVPAASSPPATFDVIIAAECLWKDTRRLHGPLAALMTSRAAPRARLIVSWGDRLTADHTAAHNRAFVDRLVDTHGWREESAVSMEEVDLLQEGGAHVLVHLVILQRGAAYDSRDNPA
jgi:predicted nicotinamide N-methyase